MATLARRVGKIIFFIVLMMVVGRVTNIPANVSESFVLKATAWLYGSGNITAENTEDVIFYMNITTVLVLTCLVYAVVMYVIRRIRKA